jgi:thiamine biosynthesis lipoprotein
MTPVNLARNAMATRFEVVLYGDDVRALRAAGEEALEEIARIEAQLSLYQPASEVAHLNGRAAREPVRVTPGVFALLQHAKRISEETSGAFDITVAPLVRCWGFMRGGGRTPLPGELAEARGKVGMNLVRLDEADSTVRFAQEGVMLDLGAIGKGYAVELAAGVLREAGVGSALLHGGSSTVYALGHPPDADRWKVAIDGPPRRQDTRASPLALVLLKDESLSVSAVWGKSFQAGGKVFGHVLDPRTGRPVTGALLAAVILPSATETDALSTALLVAGSSGHGQIARLRQGMRTLLATQTEDAKGFQVEAKGVEV